MSKNIPQRNSYLKNNPKYLKNLNNFENFKLIIVIYPQPAAQNGTQCACKYQTLTVHLYSDFPPCFQLFSNISKLSDTRSVFFILKTFSEFPGISRKINPALSCYTQLSATFKILAHDIIGKSNHFIFQATNRKSTESLYQQQKLNMLSQIRITRFHQFSVKVILEKVIG